MGQLLRSKILDSLNDSEFSIPTNKYIHEVDQLFISSVDFVVKASYHTDHYEKFRERGYTFFEEHEEIDNRNFDEMLLGDDITAREYVYLSLNRLHYYEFIRRFKTPVELDISENDDIAYNASIILGGIDKKVVNRLSKFDFHVRTKNKSIVLTTDEDIKVAEVGQLRLRVPPQNAKLIGDYVHRIGVDGNEVKSTKTVVWHDIDKSFTINESNWFEYQSELGDNINTTMHMKRGIKKMSGKVYSIWKPTNYYKVEYEHILRSAKKSTSLFHNVNHRMFMMLQNKFEFVPSWRWYRPKRKTSHVFEHQQSARFERYYWQRITSKPISYNALLSTLESRGIDITDFDSIMDWHDRNTVKLKRKEEYEDVRFNKISDNIDPVSDDDLFAEWEKEYIKEWSGSSLATKYNPETGEWVGENEIDAFNEAYYGEENKFNQEYYADKKLYKEHGIGEVSYDVNFDILEEETVDAMDINLADVKCEKFADIVRKKDVVI